jgi:hypothetical protein
MSIVILASVVPVGVLLDDGGAAVLDDGGAAVRVRRTLLRVFPLFIASLPLHSHSGVSFVTHDVIIGGNRLLKSFEDQVGIGVVSLEQPQVHHQRVERITRRLGTAQDHVHRLRVTSILLGARFLPELLAFLFWYFQGEMQRFCHGHMRQT